MSLKEMGGLFRTGYVPTGGGGSRNNSFSGSTASADAKERFERQAAINAANRDEDQAIAAANFAKTFGLQKANAIAANAARAIQNKRNNQAIKFELNQENRASNQENRAQKLFDAKSAEANFDFEQKKDALNDTKAILDAAGQAGNTNPLHAVDMDVTTQRPFEDVLKEQNDIESQYAKDTMADASIVNRVLQNNSNPTLEPFIATGTNPQPQMNIAERVGDALTPKKIYKNEVTGDTFNPYGVGVLGAMVDSVSNLITGEERMKLIDNPEKSLSNVADKEAQARISINKDIKDISAARDFVKKNPGKAFSVKTVYDKLSKKEKEWYDYTKQKDIRELARKKLIPAIKDESMSFKNAYIAKAQAKVPRSITTTKKGVQRVKPIDMYEKEVKEKYILGLKNNKNLTPEKRVQLAGRFAMSEEYSTLVKTHNEKIRTQNEGDSRVAAAQAKGLADMTNLGVSTSIAKEKAKEARKIANTELIAKPAIAQAHKDYEEHGDKKRRDKELNEIYKEYNLK